MSSGVHPSVAEIVAPDQLEAFLQIQKAKPQPKLGACLLQENLITHKQLNIAIEKQMHNRKARFGEILVAMGAVTEEAIRKVIAKRYIVPGLNLRDFHVDIELIKAIPHALAHKHRAAPLYRTRSHIVMAMQDPGAPDVKDLEFRLRTTIAPVLASAEDIDFLMRRYYGEAASVISGKTMGDGEAHVTQVDAAIESDERVVRLVDQIIVDALKQGAAEIHVETMGGGKPSRIRFCKEGAMTQYGEAPSDFRAALIARIKTMSGLNPLEKRRSQEGKLTLTQTGRPNVELLVITIPTSGDSEDVLMRILTAPQALPIDKLGVTSHILEELKILAGERRGLLVVCGPTDSGKATMLHALVGFINTPERKIWTVEDPIKVTQEGLRQLQVDPESGRTFANIIHTLLNARPAAIMLGEMRDAETVKTAVEASLAGHLIFAGMLANGAAECVVRLLEFGVVPFDLADVLIGVVGQRLVRRLCVKCRKPRAASTEEMEVLARQYCANSGLNPSETLERWRTHYGERNGAASPVLYSAIGCPECDYTGYKGRVGVHELLVGSAVLKKQIRARAEAAEIWRAASAEGMRTIKQEGIEKALQGETDLEQAQTLRS